MENICKVEKVHCKFVSLLEDTFSLHPLWSSLFFTYYSEANVFRAWGRGKYLSPHKGCEIKTALKSIHKVCSVMNSLSLYSVLICGTFTHTLQLWARSLKDIFILRVNT